MAVYRDSSGRIMIDEGEARSDVKKIDSAKSKLAQARDLLNPGKIDGLVVGGSAREALDEKLAKICADLSQLETSCGDTGNFINSTVAKYQRIDREIRDSIRGR
ncbi:MAG: hypothetical protein LBS75_06970 [Synergistaceae bacterium]|jgi:hypothetical protein|nr:hypothetical protein [Synergistaceae bacterium]